MVRALLLTAAALSPALWGCQPASNICGEQTAEMARPDGGPFRCVQAEDCPRPNNVFVCVTQGSPEEECVSCTGTRCVRHIPEPCQ